MEQRISVVTLGVADLEKSRDFYEKGLGWKVSGDEGGSIYFFQVGGSVFGLYPKSSLAKEAPFLPQSDGFGGITLAYNTRDKKEVDDTLKIAERSGAKILKSAEEVFWGGYSGYFADLDGYPWEIAYNPFWKLDDKGNIILPT